MSKATKPFCLLIGPYGKTDEERRIATSLEIVIKRAVSQKYDFKPYWQLTRMDMITDIFVALVKADLVIADLRGLNPNVMYELGIRHAFNKSVLHIKDPATELPWDIDKNFAVTYPAPLEICHQDELEKEIQERILKIESIQKEKAPSFNHFQSTCKTIAHLENLTESADIKSVLKSILGRIEAIEQHTSPTVPTIGSAFVGSSLGSSGYTSLSSLAGLNSTGMSGILQPVEMTATGFQKIYGDSERSRALGEIFGGDNAIKGDDKKKQ